MTRASLRFLVVEDEMIIELELKRADYTVCKRVTTGEEAMPLRVENIHAAVASITQP